MTTAVPAAVFVRIACAHCLTPAKQRRKRIPDLAQTSCRPACAAVRQRKNSANGNLEKVKFPPPKSIFHYFFAK
jgi:hypothetical protein